MDDVLWQRSFENDTVITALPVDEAELAAQPSPILMRARAEGRPVG